jgi:hypothetical protein
MLYEVVSVSFCLGRGSTMFKDDTKAGGDTKCPESESDGLTTLFSSDNTELTDFTERVKKAILGDEHQQQDIETPADQLKNQSGSKPTLVSSAKSNVVNLFGPK